MYSEEEIFGLLKNKFKRALPNIELDKVEIDMNMREVIVDSMERVEVITSLLKDLNLRFPLFKLAKAASIRELIALVIGSSGVVDATE